MMTTFTDPMTAMVGSQAFSLIGMASPFSMDLTWLAPLGFAAAVGAVVLVAKAVVRERESRVETAPAAPDALRRAA